MGTSVSPWVPNEHFAEGLTMHGGRLAQLTWKSPRGFYYDPATLEQTGEFRTPLVGILNSC